MCLMSVSFCQVVSASLIIGTFANVWLLGGTNNIPICQHLFIFTLFVTSLPLYNMDIGRIV